jgi:transposase/transposase IS116/IS110/IS902 family protein
MSDISKLPEGEVSVDEHGYAAYAAIDWADQKHFWKLQAVDSRNAEQGEMENTPEAVDAWATGLNVRFSGRPVAVCLEQKRGALVYMLAKYAHLVLYPIHPKTAADYRKTFCPSGAKSDPGDTGSMLDLLLRHRERLQVLRPDTVETRLLQILTEQRRCMVNEGTRQICRLKGCLKMYFPQVVKWFDDVNTPLVGDLLQRWSSLEQLQRAHPGTLKKFFHAHNCRSEERIDERIQAIYQAVPATSDRAVVEGESLVARGFVALLATLRDNIAVLDKRIKQLVEDHPDSALFGSLPGAGAVLVPRLVVAFGTQRDRFREAYEMECLSGIAPVTKSSGRSRLVEFRRACPKFLRQTFHEFAAQSIHQSEWARIYYDTQRRNKKSHHAAIRALAYKWIRIIFRCWKDNRPYDEQTYLESLHKRNSPLGGAFTQTTGAGWKLVAGFQKLSGSPS